jgi:hypothetical protein
MGVLTFVHNSLGHYPCHTHEDQDGGFMLIFSLRIVIKQDLRIRGVRINQPILGREGEAQRAWLVEGATTHAGGRRKP